jgi:type II secretory pathway component PulM
MDYSAVERARERLEAAAKERTEQAQIDAALDRARRQIEELAELAATLETTLPARVGEAVQDGIRAEALPVARQLAEVRGLAGQTIRRLERIEGDNLAERHARVDDLALLVDLITSGWRSVDERLARLEAGLAHNGGGPAYPRGETQIPS